MEPKITNSAKVYKINILVKNVYIYLSSFRKEDNILQWGLMETDDNSQTCSFEPSERKK